MIGDFLNRFSVNDRALLEAIGQNVHLKAQEHLIINGEMTGDIYLIVSGKVEICRGNQRINVLGPGQLVGELAIISDSPRSADVIAFSECELIRWPKDEIVQLCQKEESFSARFWKSLAEEVSFRLKGMNLSLPVKMEPQDLPNQDDAQELAMVTRDSLVSIDKRLRKDSTEINAKEELKQVLSILTHALASMAKKRRFLELVKVVAREIQPMLITARTAALAMQDDAGNSELLSHIIAGKASGDSPLGVAIDEWLLSLPRSQALRKRHSEALQSVEKLLQEEQLKVLLVNTGSGPLLKRVIRNKYVAHLTVVEKNLEMTKISSNRPIDWIERDLGDLAWEDSLAGISKVDLIVVDSLSEYLPAKVATQSLERLGTLLSPRGRILITAFKDDIDASLWTYILNWPVIGRSVDSFTAILHSAGFGFVSIMDVGKGLVALAGNPFKNLKPGRFAPVHGI